MLPQILATVMKCFQFRKKSIKSDNNKPNPSKFNRFDMFSTDSKISDHVTLNSSEDWIF